MGCWIRTVITTRLLQIIEIIAPVEKPWAARLVESLQAWAEHEIALVNMTRDENDPL